MVGRSGLVDAVSGPSPIVTTNPASADSAASSSAGNASGHGAASYAYTGSGGFGTLRLVGSASGFTSTPKSVDGTSASAGGDASVNFVIRPTGTAGTLTIDGAVTYVLNNGNTSTHANFTITGPGVAFTAPVSSETHVVLAITADGQYDIRADFGALASIQDPGGLNSVAQSASPNVGYDMTLNLQVPEPAGVGVLATAASVSLAGRRRRKCS